ncbi:UDP-N-acetylenolpyruvoylglucosamine reductase [Emticicia oligotrophica DSM 17448]|uniref:UDP-N-acetylenolpyruvoylglucosamine reductase n=1 Tax=Emticicia oligotrophica (strain DSM 17448 / CIP 109782 / MTCC 6937 / GPTSA100-15) TaxID=929562 RepID=A0ABN4AMU3_EMTOG|nr:UDP-N-acetylmuramate dehydrogenase [Emticicia oligotrophica]AFK03433.1 UDP-N-acetylenolpyruvoylglucosamine reductase [Emticicia oligotrophica DSM 17448]
MIVQKDVQLKPFNTFGIEATAKYFVEVENLSQLQAILQNPQYQSVERLILGGGSNMLLTKDFDGLVIKMSIKGLEIIKETDENIWIKAGAGVVWHDLVMYCVSKNYAGIENLSLIPGTVGAAPMQNIGAYGIEIKEVFEELEALEIATGDIKKFDKPTCNFGYRESIFKHEGKGKYIILNVTFKLSKKPNFHVEYGAIKDTLAEMNVNELSIKAISDAVIHIRQSKLPNPAEIGNAGSFFKNPEIPSTQFNILKEQFPNIPSYPVNETTIKVPAGWLIEQAGWKGQRFGNVGVHAKQALVLVNYGGGKGYEIKELSEKIQASVKEKFGIQLSAEVNFI